MAESKYKFDDPKAAFAEAEKRFLQAPMSCATQLDLRDLGIVPFFMPTTATDLPHSPPLTNLGRI